MSRLTTKTLMIAISALSEEVKRVEADLETASDEEAIGLQEILHDMLVAEGELEELYEPIQQRSDNLPPYERLVQRSESD